MKKDSFIINFLLGVILMILLAVAAKAQSSTPNKNNSQQTVQSKKKSITAEEAKTVYEKKYGPVDNGKRKSYSRKDIEPNSPFDNDVKENAANGVLAPVSTTKETGTVLQLPGEPKAIYKGPGNKTPSEDAKPVSPLKTEPKFIEHIEIEIGGGN